MAVHVEDPLIGKVLNGRFQIVSPLGTGGMGRVYKAVQQPLDRIVALKVLNPKYDSAKDPGFERRFFLEASLTARLKHPNTITVHDYGRTDDGIFYIAMEFIEGETLQQLLARDGVIRWQRALMVGAQICRSLREAHKLGIVHRDLKPANVMLVSDGTGGDLVKVLDFGLVKFFTPDAPPADSELTQAGVLMGSPLYMAPEQARSQADQRSDIYTLGVLLFQCIAGRPPFVGKESIDIIVRHIKEPPAQLRSLAPDVPLEINALVMKCLAKDPAARFQSMDELLDAMRAATLDQGMTGMFLDHRTFSGAVPRPTADMVDPGQGHPEIATPAPALTRPDSPRSLDMPVVSSRMIGTTPLRRALIFGALALTGVAVGGVVAWRIVAAATDAAEAGAPGEAGPEVAPGTLLVAAPEPPTEPAPEPPTRPATPEPEVSRVTFNVRSEPTGATVLREGVALGTTPLTFEVEHDSRVPVKTELRFVLDGYLPASHLAHGSSGEVMVTKELVRKRPGKRPPPPPPDKANDDGYKDDPYQ